MNGDNRRQDNDGHERNIRPRRMLFQPSAGARLSFQEMANNSQPVNVPQETFAPEIHRAVTNPLNVQVRPSNPEDPSPPPIYLLRETGAEQAYALIPEKKSIEINHRGPDWGNISFGIVYERCQSHPGSPNVFEAPSPNNVKYVAIKRLSKKAVQRYLSQGGEENPYKEIARMYELGDNVHVLKCIEALEDDEFLYIVTQKACNEGTLADCINWNTSDTMEPARVKSIFIKILKIQEYLLSKGISHRDFTPDNFLFLTHDNLVVFDLAMSHRLPTEKEGRRCLALPIGNFGTYAYMAPEIFLNRIFCGVYSDLWSTGVILYNLLTNRPVYHRPHPTDILFRYNLLARGLSNNALNDRTIEVLQEANREEFINLFERAILHSNLSPEALELLENLLDPSFANRWTLAEAMESAFVNSDDG